MCEYCVYIRPVLLSLLATSLHMAVVTCSTHKGIQCTLVTTSAGNHITNTFFRCHSILASALGALKQSCQPKQSLDHELIISVSNSRQCTFNMYYLYHTVHCSGTYSVLGLVSCTIQFTAVAHVGC